MGLLGAKRRKVRSSANPYGLDCVRQVADVQVALRDCKLFLRGRGRLACMSIPCLQDANTVREDGTNYHTR